ncbi:MAG: AAA family ATPase [Solobacterium sp.]|nr:AAA family ATPase [Solobacterium sp.]
MDVSLFESYRDRILNNCRKVILGKDDIILKVIDCFLCSGHILLEDVPGTGKTMLLRSFARSIGGDFRRIQFTPDLLPSDLTGINFYNMKDQEFEFHPGPLFAQIILADEINRATPRTQASMLEAMEERQVSIDGVTYAMKEPFMVMATQNPLESYGTFSLPEAQIDRFFMRLSMGYMEREEELKVIARKPAAVLIEELETVVTPEETAELKKMVPQITVSDDVAEYIMDIITATRQEQKYGSGVSTRGGIALYSAAQAAAGLAGRDYVIPEDVRDLACAVLAHRVGGSTVPMDESESYISTLLEKVKVPLEAV